MIPVVTPREMRDADLAALAAAGDPGVFIRRAGRAVAGAAREMMGGAYGRRVVVIAGKGNNGDDGRVAASWLEGWGALVRVVEAGAAQDMRITADGADLVIDAAYGTGLTRPWSPPAVEGVAVLAVDIPSGLDSATGAACGTVLRARRTLTFAAVKTGHLLGDGPEVCGQVDLIDVGIDPGTPRAWIVEGSDVAGWLPPRRRDAHKWHHAVRIIAGSTQMTGAAGLAAAAAMRGGAGIVHLSSRSDRGEGFGSEIVHTPLPAGGWAAFVAADAHRFASCVMGPGLGRGDDVATEVRGVLAALPIPLVVDGDALAASVDPHGGRDTLLARPAPTVLTPHDGEFAALGGDAGDPARIDATEGLAGACGCTVLRKGPVTIVATPGQPTLCVTSGDSRLATAGSGDVLAGLIGAFLARGLDAHRAAAAGAYVHGATVGHLAARGSTAIDVLGALGAVLGALGAPRAGEDGQ